MRDDAVLATEATTHSSSENGQLIRDTILRQIPTPIMAMDTEMNIIYANEGVCAWAESTADDLVGRKCYDVFTNPHCNTSDCGMRRAYDSGETTRQRTAVNVQGEKLPIEYTCAPILDENGSTIGGIEHVIDITDQVANEEMIREQSQAIIEMSTPVISMWDGVMLVPLIGSLDTARSQQMTQTILDGVATTDATVVILDVTGVPSIDTAVARHLLVAVDSARILGAEVIITGFSPDAAQTLAQLGVDFSTLRTRGSLKAGIVEAFQLIGQSIK
jgi:rsbT co-antagonist protein RsbR